MVTVQIHQSVPGAFQRCVSARTVLEDAGSLFTCHPSVLRHFRLHPAGSPSLCCVLFRFLALHLSEKPLTRASPGHVQDLAQSRSQDHVDGAGQLAGQV
jgi:hypothetical protein